MRAVVQRVSAARVVVAGDVVGAIDRGLCVLLGVANEDGEEDAARLAGRVARLRIFENDEGRFDRSLLDIGGEALVVSQFTLIADTDKEAVPASAGRRVPSRRSRSTRRSARRCENSASTFRRGASAPGWRWNW